MKAFTEREIAEAVSFIKEAIAELRAQEEDGYADPGLVIEMLKQSAEFLGEEIQ